MKTRSATKAQRVEEEEEAAEPLPLDKLAPEVLNIIAEALAADEDILIPRHLGSLARSCKVIKEAVRDAKDKLKVKYDAARALVVKCRTSVERIVEGRPTVLEWNNERLTAADAPALTNVLKSKALARLETLNLNQNSLSVEGAAAVAAGAGGLTQLNALYLHTNQIGAAGMQALASAFAGGAFRKLETLVLGGNQIGDAGLIAFAEALEKGALPALKELYLYQNTIDDEGVKALMAAAGAGWLPKLEKLYLEENEFGLAGVEALAEAIANVNLPSLLRSAAPAPRAPQPALRPGRTPR